MCVCTHVVCVSVVCVCGVCILYMFVHIVCVICVHVWYVCAISYKYEMFPQSHVFEHVALAIGAGWNGCGRFRQWSLVEAVCHWGGSSGCITYSLSAFLTESAM